MRMMNDNSKDEEIQVGNYLSYIPTELCTDQDMHKTCGLVWTKVTVCVKWRLVRESVAVTMWSEKWSSWHYPLFKGETPENYSRVYQKECHLSDCIFLRNCLNSFVVKREEGVGGGIPKQRGHEQSVGKSRIILENWSTITIMAFFPCDSGSGPIRSTDMISHEELGTSFEFRGIFFPWLSVLICWHLSHPLMYLWMSRLMVGQ